MTPASMAPLECVQQSSFVLTLGHSHQPTYKTPTLVSSLCDNRSPIIEVESNAGNAGRLKPHSHIAICK